MEKDSLGDRMKAYEMSSRTLLPVRLPVIIRIDGKAFHTYTKGCQKPWDDNLSEAMNQTAIALCSSIQGAQMAYVQSDEISVLIHSYKRFNSGAWFDNQVQKMVSVAAGIASATFTVESQRIWGSIKPAIFDARVFVLPEADVCNYFLWRQQDATRNSIQMLARSLYSHKELNNKNSLELKRLIQAKGKDWDLEPSKYRYGRCITKEFTQENRKRWIVNNEIPLFSEEREFINRFLAIESELPEDL